MNKQAKKKYMAQQIQILKVFGSIFASNFATWGVLVIVNIVLTVGSKNVPPAAYGITYLCFLFQFVIHPVLESCLSVRVRTMAKKIVCTYCLHRKVGHKDAYPT